MIATGTDVKPLECVLFMRDVRSAQYFEQMKGRGARTIAPADFQSVTPDASGKDRFVIVDAVGRPETWKEAFYARDLAGRVALHGTDRGDDSVAHGDITDERFAPEAVNDCSSANDEVICHTPNVR